MELVVPSNQYHQSYISYIQELGDEERYPFTLDLEFTDFSSMLTLLADYASGINLPTGTVQNSTLWLVDDSEIIGVTNMRHHLNERIRECGGHIGISIRPSQRGKGIGTLLMRLSIDYLKGLGLGKVHIHCYKTNSSSAKMITNNGGILESEIIDDGQVILRYIKTIA